jgi:AraC-like DNA-binding protein
MRIAGRGEIEIWEGASLWLLEAEGDSAETDYHSHHAIQITLSLDGDYELRTADERQRGPAVAVAADADHIFQASGRAAFLFVEPESKAGLAIAASLFAGRFEGKTLAVIPEDRIAGHLAALRGYRPSPAPAESLAALGKRIAADLAGDGAPRTLDRRVEAMIAYAEANLETPVSLSDAVASIGLSPSRLRHLFVEQTGLPFKTYLLRLRIRKAVEAYAGGGSLTAAAHAAGFADSAHLSRTFRRTFGIPAAALRVSGPSSRDNEPAGQSRPDRLGSAPTNWGDEA